MGSFKCLGSGGPQDHCEIPARPQLYQVQTQPGAGGRQSGRVYRASGGRVRKQG